MNSLNKLYEAMICSWGGMIKDEGRIVFQIDGTEYPIKIDNMTMHLPLSEVLDGNCVEKVFFHPACENIVSKETEVFKIIRKMTGMKLLDVFRRIPVTLFSVASGKAKSTWNQRTLDLLEPLKATKPGVRQEVNKLFARMHVEVEENGLDNRFIHFKTTKGGGASKVTGQRVYYKTKPSFPFYTEIVRRLARSEGQADNQTVELNNHSVSRAALKVAAHLFQVIVPAVNNPDDYEYEATDAVAARLVSYLGAYAEIADEMNKIQNTFRSEFDKATLYPIDLSWTETLEELPDIYRQVPVMDYNSHNTQEEGAGNTQGRNDMGSFMTVSSNNNQQPHNNQQQQHMQQASNLVGDFDVTAPPMQPGDRWVKYEIDHYNNKVIHHAINTMNNNPVIYTCSKKGNMLFRQETPLMNSGMMGNMNMLPNMGMGGGMNMNGVQQLPNGMLLLPNGQMVHPSTLGFGAQPSMPTGGNNNGYNNNVYADHNNSGGLNDSQGWG